MGYPHVGQKSLFRLSNDLNSVWNSSDRKSCWFSYFQVWIWNKLAWNRHRQMIVWRDGHSQRPRWQWWRSMSDSGFSQLPTTTAFESRAPFVDNCRTAGGRAWIWRRRLANLWRWRGRRRRRRWTHCLVCRCRLLLVFQLLVGGWMEELQPVFCNPRRVTVYNNNYTCSKRSVV